MKEHFGTRVTMHTLVGVGGNSYPLQHGNCFSLATTEAKDFRIVNFVLENFEELRRRGLNGPVRILEIGEHTAVINDERIPDYWYNEAFCEVCCPRDLLPLPQLLQHKRDIYRGRREEFDGGIVYHFDVPMPALTSVIGRKEPL